MPEAAHAVFATAICPRCSVRQPLEDFSPCSSYCRPCRRAYDAARLRAKRAGTWNPIHRDSYRRGPAPVEVRAPSPVVRVERAPATPPPGADAALRDAIYDYFRAYGFTRLRTKTEALITELAKNKRVDLAREGWIA